MSAWRALLRMARRSAWSSPRSSLLVVVLIAGVVAGGSLLMATGASSVVSAQDARGAVLGRSEIIVAFSSDGRTDVDRVSGAGLGTSTVGTRLAQSRAFNDRFDPDAVVGSIEGQHGVSVEWSRSTSLQWSAATRGPFGHFSAKGIVQDISAFDPVAAGQVELIAGRLPVEPGEVAINHSELATRRTEIGAVVDYSGVELTVVGIVISRAGLFAPTDLVRGNDFDQLLATGPTLDIEYRLYPETGWLPADVPEFLASAQTHVDPDLGVRLHARVDEAVFLPTASAGSVTWIEAGLDNGRVATSDTTGQIVVPTMMTVVIATLVALMAAAAFTVAVRRRARHYAILGVVGADRPHIRAVVVAEALLLGIAGAFLGAAIARLVAPRLPGYVPLVGYVSGLGIDLAWSDTAIPAAIGLVAATAAAWWPAGRVAQASTQALMAGRFPSKKPGRATSARALMLLLAGAGAIVVSTRIAESSRDPMGPLVVVAIFVATLAMVFGTLGLVGPLLAAVGRRAANFPLLARLVVRDSDRNRTRSWVSVGAIMMLLAGPVFLGAVMDSDPVVADSQGVPLSGRLVTFYSLSSISAPTDSDLALQDQIDTLLDDSLQSIGSIDRQAVLFDLPDVRPLPRRLVLGTDELLDALSVPESVRDALRQGKLVDVSAAPVRTYTQIRVADSEPVPVIQGPAYFTSAFLVAPDASPIIDIARREAGVVRVMADEVSWLDEVRIRAEANAEWSEITQHALDRLPSVRLDLPRQSGPDARTVTRWVVGIIAAFATVVALTLASLAATEADHDMSAMIAAGASPRLRRGFLGMQTLYHMGLAALFGIPLGVIGFWVARIGSKSGVQPLIVPWSMIATLLVVPLVVAAIVTVVFRNGRTTAPRRLS